MNELTKSEQSSEQRNEGINKQMNEQTNIKNKQLHKLSIGWQHGRFLDIHVLSFERTKYIQSFNVRSIMSVNIMKNCSKSWCRHLYTDETLSSRHL